MQDKTFKPQLVAVRNESLVDELKEALGDLKEKLEIIHGEQGIIEIVHHPDDAGFVTSIVKGGKLFNMSKNVKKKIERGVAFPTCISVNNSVCHFSPLASDESVLEEGDIMKIDLGCHIDGFIVFVAHTHALQGGPMTSRTADVIAAANTAAEVALRLARPGKKTKFAFLQKKM